MGWGLVRIGGAAVVAFPGWPSTFEGRTLTPLPLNEMETKFATGFPGRIARFSDGEREIINIDCDPTTDVASGAIQVVQIDDGSWEFRLVLNDDFEDDDPLFKRFQRYGLDPQTVSDACRKAMRVISP